jgi:hypothetical protein
MEGCIYSKEYTTNIDDKADLCNIEKTACLWVPWLLSPLSTLASAAFIFCGRRGDAALYIEEICGLMYVPEWD